VIAASFESPHDVRAPLDLGVEPLQRIGRVDLHVVRLREAHEREHIGLRAVEHRGELRELGSQLIGDGAPLRDGGLQALLRAAG
jgi:hypothetical protein